MANFIENWRNSLANWLERDQSNVSHLSDISDRQKQKNIPGSPWTVDRGAAIKTLRRGGVLDPNIKNPYLGNSRGDFNSPEYFSNNTYAEAPYSESFIIKGANQDGKGPWQNTYDLDVRYDENGAIYGVYLRDASGRGRGMSALGADELSDFFKSLGLDTNSYVVKRQGTPKEVKIGRGSDIYRPTDIFGIDGIFSR